MLIKEYMSDPSFSDAETKKAYEDATAAHDAACDLYEAARHAYLTDEKIKEAIAICESAYCAYANAQNAFYAVRDASKEYISFRKAEEDRSKTWDSLVLFSGFDNAYDQYENCLADEEASHERFEDERRSE